MDKDANPKVIYKITTLNNARKIALDCVNRMSEYTATESNCVEFEGRPSRLGLGAKVALNAKAVESNDPVERKLLKDLKKVKAVESNEPVERKLLKDMKNGKQLSSKTVAKAISTENSCSVDDEDDVVESRTNAFTKKRNISLPTYSLLTKRSK